MSWTWLVGMVRRRPARLLVTSVGIAVGVALLAGLGGFQISSEHTMTQRAAAGVAVDWQVEVAAHRDPSAVLKAAEDAPLTQAALPVGFADTPGLRARAGGTVQETGAGKVLGLPPDYVRTFPLAIRVLRGNVEGPVVAQQTAANLHVSPGDEVKVRRTGAPAYRVRITGVVELPQADSLFQRVGAPPQSQLSAPPDNVVLLPQQVFRRQYAGLANQRPDLVTTQIHAARDQGGLPNAPADAFTQESGAANNLDVRTAGAGTVGDNLAAALDGAREDAAYARLLFLFLGAPGLVLAVALTAAVAQSGAERRRREQTLLRSRGAAPRQLTRLALLEALVVGVIGITLGLAVAIAFGTATSPTWNLVAASTGLAVAVAVVIAPAVRDLRHTSVNRRAQRAVHERPLWLRFGLDLLLVTLGLVVFRASSQNHYTLVLAPEGVPTVSVSYWAFLGPVLAWLGGGLFCWRMADLLLRHGRRGLAVVAGPFLGTLATTTAAVLGRRRRTVARSTVLLALAVAFAFTTSTFNSTYRQQAEVDAELTNGADITVSGAPGAGLPASEGRRLESAQGVQAVEQMLHRFTYVGNDLQDLFGIHPSTLRRATRLQDSYFQGETAAQALDQLASRPDAALVSAETVLDFQLKAGDLVRLRVQDARTHRYQVVPFHYVGIVNEFPSAPKDSFVVANADYVAAKTHSHTVDTFLVSTGGQDTDATASRVRALVGTSATVGTLQDARGLVSSSLASVDLSRLTAIELTYAFVLAISAGGLLLGLGLVERRHGVALATALGAHRARVRAFGAAESVYVLVVGTVVGLGGGWGLSLLVVNALTGAFDPPPTSLTIPWGYLTAVLATVVGSVLAATMLVIEHARRRSRALLRRI